VDELADSIREEPLRQMFLSAKSIREI